MRRVAVAGLASALLSVLVAAGCNPAAPSAPAPAAQPAPAPDSRPVAAPAPEDATWQKVIEAAKKEGTVTAYDYFLVGDIGLSVSRAFEARYGIKLSMIPGRGAELLERVKTERRLGQMTGDYIGSSAPNVMNFKREGLTESTADKLPGLKDKTKFALDIRDLDPSGHLLGFNYNNYTPYINTKLLKPEQAPKSLQDFLDPKWQGKIIARDPIISSGEYISWVPLLNRGIIDKDYLRKLGDQRLVFHLSAQGAADMLARGDAPLHTPGADSSFGKLALEGAPIKAIALEHGSMAYMSAIAAIKNPPHPNATLLFLNWRMGPEGQAAYSKASGEASVRNDVQDFRHPNIVSGGKIAFIASDKDMDDAGTLFREKMLTPLLKR